MHPHALGLLILVPFIKVLLNFVHVCVRVIDRVRRKGVEVRIRRG